MINSTSAAVLGPVSCGAKVSTAPPAMVTVNNTNGRRHNAAQRRQSLTNARLWIGRTLGVGLAQHPSQSKRRGHPQHRERRQPVDRPQPNRSTMGTDPGNSTRLGTRICDSPYKLIVAPAAGR